MKKRIISLTMALVLSALLALTAWAAPTEDFVVDAFDLLADSELEALNAQAQQLYADTGVGVFFIYTTEPELQELDPAQYAGSIKDYYMIENEDAWWSFSAGKGAYIDEEIETHLRDAYDESDTYYGGIAAYLTAASTYLPGLPPETGPSASAQTDAWLVMDNAGLLTDGQSADLYVALQKVSQKYHAQILVVTVPSLEGGDIDGFVEFIYDEMAFGYGDARDGVLLLVCMDPREYRILSNGFAADAIGSDEIDAMGDAFQSDLSAGNFAEAFATFADKCAYYLDGHLNGFPFDVTASLGIALVIGILAGLIVAFVLKGQLKSVHKQSRADVYVRPDSMQLTVQNDFFLYRTVDRRKKESSSSGSSGSSRNVGGGSF